MSAATALRLANEHRGHLSDVTALARRDFMAAQRLITGTSNKEWASLSRSMFQEISTNYGGVAAQISASYYDLSRKAWQDSYGVKMKTFAADPSHVMRKTAQLVVPKTEQIGYQISKAIQGDHTRIQAMTEALGVLDETVFNFSRSEVTDMAERDSSAEKSKRVVRTGGCIYCQFTAFADDTTDQEFHSHCNCVVSVEFVGGEPIVQPGEEDFLDRYQAAKKEAGGNTDRKTILSALRQLGK